MRGIIILLVSLLIPCLHAADSLATQLIAVRKGGASLTAPSVGGATLSPEQAYAVQDEFIETLVSGGEVPCGFKVGFTGKAAQQAWGVDGPASGPLFSSMRCADGSSISHAEFHTLIIEAEIAFTLASDIRTEADLTDLRSKVASWHLAFDIPDVRYDLKAGKPTGAEIIADGMGAHRFVIGTAQEPASLDIATVVSLARDDAVMTEAPCSAALGSPWTVLDWLARQQIAKGKILQKGAIVLTGALGKPYLAKTVNSAKGTYLARYQDLKLSVTITE